MPKILLICRHAEAEDPAPDQPDFDRNLTAAGIMQASKTGAWLQSQYQVQALIASPARRTWQTSRVLAEMLHTAPETIELENALYNAPVHAIINKVLQLPDNLDAVMLVGHNPGVSQVIEAFTGSSAGYLEPANVAVLVFETDTWQDAEVKSCNLQHVYKP